MKQTICKRIGKMLSCIAVMSVVLAMGMLSGCAVSDNPGKDEKSGADLVVIGKIFTSENNQMAEAFAVKDGKYVYVGDKAGAEQYIVNGKTEVIDYTGKGLVMPGCGNGHSHYMLGYALKTIGTMIGLDVNTEKFLKEIVPAAVKKAKAEGATSIASIQCQPERTWMPSAATSPCTSWTRNVTRHWATPSC